MNRLLLVDPTLAATQSPIESVADSEKAARAYGRAMGVSSRGIVATSQYLASQAGPQMLGSGGSAMLCRLLVRTAVRQFDRRRVMD